MGADAEKQSGHELSEDGGASEADDGASRSEASGFAEGQAKNIGALSAQGEADAKFLGALGHGVCHDAKNSDGGEGECDGGENSEEGEVEFLRCGGKGDDGIHGADVGGRQGFVEGPDLLLGGGDNVCRITRAADDEGHPAFPGLAVLGVEVINCGFLGLVEAEMLYVAGDADDYFPVGRIIVGPADALADGILAREKSASEGLVDDGYGGGIGTIAGIEGAALENGNAHDLKIIAEYGTGFGVGMVAGTRGWLRLDGGVVRDGFAAHGKFAAPAGFLWG